MSVVKGLMARLRSAFRKPVIEDDLDPVDVLRSD